MPASPCVASVVLVLSILQLGNLPVSVTGIIAACAVLCQCCGGPDGGCAKCCFIACSVLSAISACVSFGVGAFMLAGRTCDNWQATWNAYLTYNTTDVFDLANCDQYTEPIETYVGDDHAYYSAALCLICNMFSTVGVVMLVCGCFEALLCLFSAKAGCCSGGSRTPGKPFVVAP